MDARIFGRTGHNSTVAVFGGAAFWEVSQEEADNTMEIVVQAGVNHIDVAPQYGAAEELLGPWMRKMREQFFLGCKTMERNRASAMAELQRSLERLQTDHFDLYQLHAVNTLEELDQATGPGGALEAILEARGQGLTRFIGITGHGWQVPTVFLQAVERFDFDSVLLPVNFTLFADVEYRKQALQLLDICQQRSIGVMAIKAVARGPWKNEAARTHTTWYQPFTEPQLIQQSVNFTLSQPITALITPGDTQLVPLVLEACQNFEPLTRDEQQAAITIAASQYKPVFEKKTG